MLCYLSLRTKPEHNTTLADKHKSMFEATSLSISFLRSSLRFVLGLEVVLIRFPITGSSVKLLVSYYRICLLFRCLRWGIIYMRIIRVRVNHILRKGCRLQKKLYYKPLLRCYLDNETLITMQISKTFELVTFSIDTISWGYRRQIHYMISKICKE